MLNRAQSAIREIAVMAATAALGGVLAGCSDFNEGVAPPRDQFHFPSGLLVDPRAPEGVPARWLFVANANSDLRFNAGSILSIDLDAFWNAWYDPMIETVDPFCGDQRCVQPAGAPTSATFPCRRLALMPQVVECDESTFVAAGVNVSSFAHVGNFGTVMASSVEPGGNLRLWLPIRGDPSITFVDVLGSFEQEPELRCGQGDDPDQSDELKCTDAFRLTHIRNDEDLGPLGREPFNIMIHERLGYVAHAQGADLTLFSLDGVTGDSRPAIVETAPLFFDRLPGGFGLAARPCFLAAQGPPDDPEPDQPNAPAVTRGCERPLIYSSWRFIGQISSFTASPLELGSDDPGRFCATPDQIGEPGAVVCDPRIRGIRQFGSGGLPVAGTNRVLGDIAFADPRGDSLYAVQTNPGALLRINTDLDLDNEPFDEPSSPPIEICAEPTRMVVHDNGEERLAIISCFRAALIFVVDLEAARVIQQIVVGTGPHDLVVDAPREVVYAANTLERSISVIDISRTRATKFTEIARIGLQEPFSQ